jgi:hypothetical protein
VKNFKRTPASSVVIPSKLGKDSVRKKIRWGPYTLPGANVALPFLIQSLNYNAIEHELDIV